MASKGFPWERCNEFLLEVGSVHEPYRFCMTVLNAIDGLIPHDQALMLMLDGNRKIVRYHFVGFSERWKQMYLNYYSRSMEGEFALSSDAFEIEGKIGRAHV